MPRVSQLESGEAARPADSREHCRLQCTPPAFRMSPLGPRGPGAVTRQVVEAGSWGATQSWGYLPLFSLSRAAGELEAGGDYVKVRD